MGGGGKECGCQRGPGVGGGVCPLCATGWCCMPSCPWCPMVLLAAWPWPTRVSPCLTQHKHQLQLQPPPPHTPCPVLPPCSLVVDVCDHVTDETAPSHADDHQGHAWSAAAAAEGVSTAADTPTSTWVLDVPPPKKNAGPDTNTTATHLGQSATKTCCTMLLRETEPAGEWLSALHHSTTSSPAHTAQQHKPGGDQHLCWLSRDSSQCGARAASAAE